MDKGTGLGEAAVKKTQVSENTNTTSSPEKTLVRSPSRESVQDVSPSVKISSHSKHHKRLELLRMKKIKDPIMLSITKRLAQHSSMTELTAGTLSEQKANETKAAKPISKALMNQIKKALSPVAKVGIPELSRPHTEWDLLKISHHNVNERTSPDFKGWTFATWKSSSSEVRQDNSTKMRITVSGNSRSGSQKRMVSAVSSRKPTSSLVSRRGAVDHRTQRQEAMASHVGLFVEEAVRTRLNTFMGVKYPKPMSKTFHYPTQTKQDEILEGRDELHKRLYVSQIFEKFRLKHGGKPMSLIPSRYGYTDPFRSFHPRGSMSSEDLLKHLEEDDLRLKTMQSQVSHKEYSLKYQENYQPTMNQITAKARNTATNSQLSTIQTKPRVSTQNRPRIALSSWVSAQQKPKNATGTSSNVPVLVIPPHPTAKSMTGAVHRLLDTGLHPHPQKHSLNGWSSPALGGWAAGELDVSHSGLTPKGEQPLSLG